MIESAAAPARSNGEPMCAKCTELDNKIARYRRIATQVTDKQALDGIARLIEQMTTEKATIQCEPASKPQ